MKTITKTYNVYSFDELSDEAKENSMETYVIYDNAVGEFYENSLPCDEHELFTTANIDSAHQFNDIDEATDFCDKHFVDAVVLRWM